MHGPHPTPDTGKPSVFLANVGANSSHSFLSPLFDDGTFEFITIPEEPLAAGPHSVRYRDLRSHFHPNELLARWVPDRLLDKATHFDPEFGTNTYGDNCERSPRAFGLKEARPGDLIYFLVRLARWSEGRFTGETGFFLIGFIEVESIFRAPDGPTEAASPPRYAANAHVRRAMNDSQYWDGFWVFSGSERSTRFPRAVPVDRAFADRTLRTATGQPYIWPPNRSELQVIGSYTRACRRIIDPRDSTSAARIAALKQAVEEGNPGALESLL